MTVVENEVSSYYDEFLSLVESNAFKVNEIDVSEYKDIMYQHESQYSFQKKEAERYNIGSLYTVFDDLCKSGGLVDIHTYMTEYEKRIDFNFKQNILNSKLEKEIIKNIMMYRGVQSYVSNLAELSFKLMVMKIYGDKYNIHSNRDTDLLLGVDLILEDEEEDFAHYIHVTTDSYTARTRLTQKGNKTFKVFDYNEQKNVDYTRNFEGHVAAEYTYGNSEKNKYINDVPLFTEEYVRELIESNKGKASKAQLKSLEYLGLRKKGY